MNPWRLLCLAGIFDHGKRNRTISIVFYCIVYIYFHNFMNLCRTDVTTWDLVVTKLALYTVY